MKLKLVIVIVGGNFQSVYTNRPDVSLQIDVIDCDNLRAEGHNGAQIDHILETRATKMTLLEY